MNCSRIVSRERGTRPNDKLKHGEGREFVWDCRRSEVTSSGADARQGRSKSLTYAPGRCEFSPIWPILLEHPCGQSLSNMKGLCVLGSRNYVWRSCAQTIAVAVLDSLECLETFQHLRSIRMRDASMQCLRLVARIPI